jgi:hypothetical protein
MILNDSTGIYSAPGKFFNSFHQPVLYFAVGEDSNRGSPPWPVSSPATFINYKKNYASFLNIF